MTRERQARKGPEESSDNAPRDSGFPNLTLAAGYRACPYPRVAPFFMSTTKILIQLQNESAFWRHERVNTSVLDSTCYMDGTINGLKKAIKIVEDSMMQEKNKRPKLSRWHAADFHRACESAVNYLKRDQVKRAIVILERVLRKVEA
jgi:hypothetical protein